MLYGVFSEEFLEEPTTVELTRRDIMLIEEALRFLLESSTRHEHVFGDIHALLEKLPVMKEKAAA